MAKNIKTEQGTVTDQEMMEAMRIIGKYCAEHPHCVRCAIISHCGATPPQGLEFFRAGGITEWIRTHYKKQKN